jgi:hypothetical protein
MLLPRHLSRILQTFLLKPLSKLQEFYRPEIFTVKCKIPLKRVLRFLHCKIQFLQRKDFYCKNCKNPPSHARIILAHHAFGPFFGAQNARMMRKIRA